MIDTMLKNFTYDEYRELLQRVSAGRANLCFGDFHKPVEAERFFLLRHDVDYCPEVALAMAEVEAELGIRATYFMLLTSRHYNLLSERYITAPRKLRELGHEVGLHYDLSVLESVEGLTPTEVLSQQAEMLGSLAGDAIQSIAMHNPSLSGADPFRQDKRFVNTYHEAFTRDIAYFSDSCGAWRDKAHATLTGPAEDIPKKLQLLIHPMLWGEKSGTRWDRLAAWQGDQQTLCQGSVDRVTDIWRNHSGVAEHDNR